ncbi:SDR family NAD(P)-dependent oxidoreductase [Shimia aestuarii]|uniref:Short-chain dehydrogenase n=1 Tax=Shimia aestuarii TaxID=254406 RepID=A0A1I4NAQ4_9RHOB|nr:SDR family NAD(P)-dependent oxidoreductase [Shimia aestuarii]SFM12578.1 Short-chain dehydrogenase [Shimia aestuarii]
MKLHRKTYWIVGASEGLGRALATALSREGTHLILSARSAEKLSDLAARLPNAEACPLDVTDPSSVRDTWMAVIRGKRLPDGVIYCAGAYDPMTAQAWDTEAVEQMVEVNFTGALRILGNVVPAMTRRGEGHVVLIGSLAGHRGLPGAIGYGASKAALMHLGENLRADLRGTGVRVQCLNPGFIRTRLTDKNSFEMPMLMSPEKAADHCVRAMKTRRFSTSFPAPFSWLFTIGRHVPLPWFQTLFRQGS